MKGNTKLLIFLYTALFLILLSWLFGWRDFLTDEAWLLSLRGLVDAHYADAVIIYVFVTAFSCVLLAVPGITFALIAGMLFDPLTGCFFCLAGTTLGAVLSFLAGRYFLQDSLKPMILKNAHLSRVLFSTKESNAVLLLLITRVLPFFPFNLQNFAYGVTDIRVTTYTWATFVFMIPGVVFFTLITEGFLQEGFGSTLWWIIAAAVALIAMGLLARQAYRRQHRGGITH